MMDSLPDTFVFLLHSLCTRLSYVLKLPPKDDFKHIVSSNYHILARVLVVLDSPLHLILA